LTWLFLAVFIEATIIAKISFPSLRSFSNSILISEFLLISIKISRKKLLSSASSSTIFNLFIKSADDFALLDA
jgi:hypothetical protein